MNAPDETYSPAVLDHFRHPRNVGRLDDADGVGASGNADCGDTVTVFLRIRDERITEIRFPVSYTHLRAHET